MIINNKIDRFRNHYFFLSNFFPVKVEYEGKIYPSAEHAYQAAKTLDHNERNRIANLPTAADSKREGRKLALRSDWDSQKLDVMYKIVYSKFSCNDKLLDALLSTLDSELIEGNEHADRFFGVYKGIGENHLGKILMRVRDKLRAEVRIPRKRVFNKNIDLDYRSYNPVYIGRPSIFGNPFVVSAENNHEMVVEMFKRWVILGDDCGNKFATRERRQLLIDNLDSLNNQNMLCFCNPKPCHGDVLLKIVNNEHRQKGRPTVIAGSRSITDIKKLDKVINDNDLKISLVVSGTAKGVDQLGEQWAMDNYVLVKQFPAKWYDDDGNLDKAAGHKRNRYMGDYVRSLNGRLVCLWDGVSKGTLGMIEYAKKIQLETDLRLY